MRHPNLLSRSLAGAAAALFISLTPALGTSAGASSSVPAVQSFCAPSYAVLSYHVVGSWDPALLLSSTPAGVRSVIPDIAALSALSTSALSTEPKSATGMSALNDRLSTISVTGSKLAGELGQLATLMQSNSKVPAALLRNGTADAKAVMGASNGFGRDVLASGSWTSGYKAVCGQWATAALRVSNVVDSSKRLGANWIVTQASLISAIKANGKMQLVSTTVGSGMAGTATLLVHAGTAPSGIAIYAPQKADIQICVSIPNKGHAAISVIPC